MVTIKTLFKNYVKYPVVTIILGIKNLWRWFPVIWWDRDWDNGYIETLLYRKLINTYNFFVSEDAVTNWDVPEQEKALRALRICIVILERKRTNFYVDICSNQYEEHIIRRSFEIEDRDQKILGKLLGKYLSHWWD